MDRTEEREFWCEFIDLYKSHPVLWKVNSDIYKDRAEKKQAYKELVNKLAELTPRADVDMVKRKINSLRACYRREMKKVREHEIVGGGSDDEEYVPGWCYFKYLSFLHGQDHEEPADIKPDMDLGEFEMSEVEVPAKRRGKRRRSPPPRDQEQRDRLRTRSCDVESLEDPCQAPAHRQPLPQPRLQICSHSREDEADVLGKCWAFQYRSLPDEQRLYAQKAISDIFFQAKLGLLRRNSANEIQSK